MIDKMTVFLFIGAFFAILLLPAPHVGSPLLNWIFPEAHAQLPVFNVTTTIDAPCVVTEDFVDADMDGLDDVLNKPECTCFEQGTCDVFSAPLDAMLDPFFNAFSFAGEFDFFGVEQESGQFFLIAIWGLVIGVIWLRTSSTMITGVVGIGISSIFVFNERAILVGMTLLIISIGIIIYQLYKQRLEFPTN